MERMEIRNPKIKKWRGLLILALIGAIITGIFYANGNWKKKAIS